MRSTKPGIPCRIATALLLAAIGCSRPTEGGKGAHSAIDGRADGLARQGIGKRAPKSSGRALGTADLVAKCEPSVALVKGKLGVGTGFLVAEGLLATNAHVIDEEFIDGVEILFPSADDANKGPFHAVLLYEDAARDLALLAVPTSLPPLEVAGAYEFRKGEDVTVIGNPGIGDEEVLENAISRGVMSSRTNLDGQAFYQLGIAINPGNSGGPVLDQSGRVLGVASKKATKQEALAFCIPAADLDAAIELVATQPETAALATASRHRLTNAFRLLGRGGALYAVGLDVHRLALEQGPGVTLGSGDKSLSIDDFNKVLDKIDRRAFVPAEAQAGAIRNDALIDATTRLKISELAGNYAAMKTLFAQVGGDLYSYRARVKDLKERHRKLIVDLKAPLKVELPPNLLTAFQDDNVADPVATIAGNTPRLGRGLHDPFGSSLRDRMEERRQDSFRRMQGVRERMGRGRPGFR